MNELVPTRDAFLRVVAEHHAVDLAQIAVAIDRPIAAVTIGRPHLLHRRLYALHAIFRLRVRLQPIRRPVAIGDLINPRQRREKHRDLGGIPSARGRIFRAERVGLQLVLTAVFQEHGAETGLGKLAERPNLRHEDAADEHAHGCDRRPRILLRGMARGHVPDFMPEHAGQLGLIVQIRQNAARDVDVSARQRERVHRG